MSVSDLGTLRTLIKMISRDLNISSRWEGGGALTAGVEVRSQNYPRMYGNVLEISYKIPCVYMCHFIYIRNLWEKRFPIFHKMLSCDISGRCRERFNGRLLS